MSFIDLNRPYSPVITQMKRSQGELRPGNYPEYVGRQIIAKCFYCFYWKQNLINLHCTGGNTTLSSRLVKMTMGKEKPKQNQTAPHSAALVMETLVTGRAHRQPLRLRSENTGEGGGSGKSRGHRIHTSMYLLEFEKAAFSMVHSIYDPLYKCVCTLRFNLWQLWAIWDHCHYYVIKSNFCKWHC